MTPDVRKVAFLGDYPPRKCGIATFTADLRCAMSDSATSVATVSLDAQLAAMEPNQP